MLYPHGTRHLSNAPTDEITTDEPFGRHKCRHKELARKTTDDTRTCAEPRLPKLGRASEIEIVQETTNEPSMMMIRLHR
jgi:hypothetical protein